MMAEVSNCERRILSFRRTDEPSATTNLRSDSSLAVGSNSGSGGLLGSNSLGVQVGDNRRNGRRGLLEAGGDIELLLVDFLGALLLLVLEDGLEVVLGSVEEGDTNIGLLESSDVVGTISGHERNVAERLERGEDELFLSGRNAGVDPGVLDEDVPRLGLVGVLTESGAGHADVVLLEEGDVEGRIGADGDNDRLVRSPPSEVCENIEVSARGSQAESQVPTHPTR